MGVMTADEPSTSRLAKVRAARIEKLAKLRELGVDPYPSTFGDRQAVSEEIGRASCRERV